MRIVPVFSVILYTAFGSGCTFVTSCPTGSNSSNNASGGSANQGGASAGGSSVITGPTPTGTWVNETSNLANKPSECGNMSWFSGKPDEDLLIAGIAQAGLWGSRDGGDHWAALGTAADSDQIINRTSYIAYDPSDTNTFWESGIYNAGGVYVTHDDGVTFKQLGSVTHDDYVSIDFSDPDRKTLLVNQHEQKQQLMWSHDQGATWTEIGQNIPASAITCSYPYVLDSQTFLLGCGVTLSGTGDSGIYKSRDAGQSWTSVSLNEGGASAPLLASDGSIYWVTQFGGGMVRSTDQGDTWTQVVSPGVIDNIHPIELPDGRIVTISGVKILASADQGATWQAVTADAPYGPAGVVYSSFRKAFFIWHNSCDPEVAKDAVMRYDFDYTTM